MKRVLSVGLAALMLASSVAYAADGVMTKSINATNFGGNGRYQICSEGKIGGGLGKNFGMMNERFGKNMEKEGCITDVLDGVELTDAQKTKVETIKTNQILIKELREKINVKEREIIGDTTSTNSTLTDAQKKELEDVQTQLKELEEKRSELMTKMKGIVGDRKMGKENMANLTDAQKEKINAIREKLQLINKPNVSEDDATNTQEEKIVMSSNKKLTNEERAEKLLADIDNIITKQETKIKALKEILADL
ncbi:MAG TPA: hypothetical protein DCP90_06995 [Clostridiales bacterium]|nr:MAG: hypothetical protein A2Y22_02275 [Clostridiales bacterium GWD2_32_59]HAN10342.1 hypothetical protein [Clostridiales bacterium]